MMKSSKSVAAALAVAVLIAGLSGCKEGPAERAGKQVDQAVDKAGQQVDKAVDKVGQQIEKAGEKVKDAVKK